MIRHRRWEHLTGVMTDDCLPTIRAGSSRPEACERASRPLAVFAFQCAHTQTEPRGAADRKLTETLGSTHVKFCVDSRQPIMSLNMQSAEIICLPTERGAG